MTIETKEDLEKKMKSLEKDFWGMKNSFANRVFKPRQMSLLKAELETLEAEIAKIKSILDESECISGNCSAEDTNGWLNYVRFCYLPDVNPFATI